MEKNEITIYSTVGDALEKEVANYAQVIFMVARATGTYEKAQQLIESCETEGKRLIFYYPTSAIDTSGWALIGEVDDGLLYVG